MIKLQCIMCCVKVCAVFVFKLLLACVSLDYVMCLTLLFVMCLRLSCCLVCVCVQAAARMFIFNLCAVIKLLFVVCVCLFVVACLLVFKFCVV